MDNVTALIITENPVRFEGWAGEFAKQRVQIRFISPVDHSHGEFMSQPTAWLADAAEVDRWGEQRLRTILNQGSLGSLSGIALVSSDHLRANFEWLNHFDHLALMDQGAENIASQVRWVAQRPTSVDEAARRIVRLVNHDINNPLTAIRILSEMLLGDISDEMAQTDLKDIMEAADVAAATVESLSLSMKASEEFNTATWVATDLGALLQDAMKRPALANCVVVPGNLGSSYVEGDQSLVKSAMTDVLMNARKMTDGRTRVEVMVQGDSSTSRFVCRSAEIGIPMEYWEHLTTEYGAIYLREKRFPVVPTGLFAASKIMQLHGGRLQIDLADDGGLQVSCIFPAARRA